MGQHILSFKGIVSGSQAFSTNEDEFNDSLSRIYIKEMFYHSRGSFMKLMVFGDY